MALDRAPSSSMNEVGCGGGWENPPTRESGAPGLEEEVEEEEGQAEEHKEGAEGEAAAVELRDGAEETDGDDAKTGFAAAQIEWSGGNVARKIAAEEREFVVDPDHKFRTVAPKIKGAENKNGIAETRENAERRTITPRQHRTSQH